MTQTQYQAQLNIGQGSDQVQNAQATVSQAQQTLRLDQQNLNRYQTLLNSGYVSQQQVDQQRTTVRNDQQQVNSARATLQSATLNQRVNGSAQSGLQAANVASAQADAASAHAQARADSAQIARSRDHLAGGRRRRESESQSRRVSRFAHALYRATDSIPCMPSSMHPRQTFFAFVAAPPFRSPLPA